MPTLNLAEWRGFFFGVKPEANMSAFDSLGLGTAQLPGMNRGPVVMLSEAQVLGRALEFTGYTIHDVINDPIARNTVAGYYGLYRYIERHCEMMDLPPRSLVHL